MVFEIWDLDSGNRLGEFATEAEAVAEVKHALDQHGEEYVATLLLDAEDEGRTQLIAQGPALVALARGTTGADQPGHGPTERIVPAAAEARPQGGVKAKPR
jgi:hypothetical protein